MITGDHALGSPPQLCSVGRLPPFLLLLHRPAPPALAAFARARAHTSDQAWICEWDVSVRCAGLHRPSASMIHSRLCSAPALRLSVGGWPGWFITSDMRT
jgi:hypothetical protein